MHDLKITSLNCRSLKKHFEDILADSILLKSDVISLQETWLDENDCLDDFKLPDYELHVIRAGRGRGISTYFRSSLIEHDRYIKNMTMMMKMMTAMTMMMMV